MIIIDCNLFALDVHSEYTDFSNWAKQMQHCLTIAYHICLQFVKFQSKLYLLSFIILPFWWIEISIKYILSLLLLWHYTSLKKTVDCSPTDSTTTVHLQTGYWYYLLTFHVGNHHPINIPYLFLSSSTPDNLANFM